MLFYNTCIPVLLVSCLSCSISHLVLPVLSCEDRIITTQKCTSEGGYSHSLRPQLGNRHNHKLQYTSTSMHHSYPFTSFVASPKARPAIGDGILINILTITHTKGHVVRDYSYHYSKGHELNCCYCYNSIQMSN